MRQGGRILVLFFIRKHMMPVAFALFPLAAQGVSMLAVPYRSATCRGFDKAYAVWNSQHADALRCQREEGKRYWHHVLANEK